MSLTVRLPLTVIHVESFIDQCKCLNGPVLESAVLMAVCTGKSPRAISARFKKATKGDQDFIFMLMCYSLCICGTI